MNLDYCISWVDQKTPGVLFRNTMSPFYRSADEIEKLGDSSESYKLLARKDCRRCHARGGQVWDQGPSSGESYLIACPCVQRLYDKSIDYRNALRNNDTAKIESERARFSAYELQRLEQFLDA
jgi:hypothetical protein